MKVEVHSQTPISDATITTVASAVEAGLGRFSERLTRTEVHLKNLGHTKPTLQPECRLETRPANRDPVSVSNHAAALDDAVKGAVEKMTRLLDSTFGRIDAPVGPSASGLPT